MLKNERPMDLGNVNVMNTKTVREKFTLNEIMEDIYNCLLKEPKSIGIKRDENSKKEVFVRIIRIHAGHQKNKNYSWNIYSREREAYSDLVIRRVIWDLDKDIKLLKEHKGKRIPLTEWLPSAEICNIYIPPFEAEKIIHLIKKVDSEVEKGFILHKNKNQSKQWHDIELLRLYDWGQIHLNWCSDRKNKEVENRIKKLVKELDSAIKEGNENIFEMTLNYYDRDPREYSSENLLKLWEENNVEK